MNTLFNYWHYIVLGIILLIFVGGVVSALKQSNQKLVFPMIVSVSLISVLLAFFSIFVVNKYTKEVKLYKLENKRLLNLEKIVYTGVVKNEGDFEIGTVILTIKLVNKGHATGNLKPSTFYRVSDLFDFFGGGDVLYKPQTIEKEFVVATNLKPGNAQSFRIYFDFPPYFRSVAQFATVSGN